jgi:tRNA A-37 threonylcarbamoyl transferase component Bud32
MTDVPSIVADATQPIAGGPVPGAAAPLARGLLLANRYRLGRQLSQGGTADVYEATQIDLIRRVAVKILAPDATTEQRRLFEQEARLAARLAHPHIAAVHDFGFLAGGTPFMVMELVEGPTLREHLAVAAPLPASEALRFGRQLAAALECAHEANVVHGNLGATNVLLQKSAHSYSCKLIDFGAAREMAEAQTDIAALGALLTQMLGIPAPASLSAGLRRLLASLLSQSPAQRPQTMSEVRKRLQVLSADRALRPPPPHVLAAAGLGGLAVLLLAVAVVGDPAVWTAPMDGAESSRAPQSEAAPAVPLRGAALEVAPVTAAAVATTAVLRNRGDESLARAEILAALDRALARRNENAARERYPVMARREGAARISFTPDGSSASVRYRKRFASAAPGAVASSTASAQEHWVKVGDRWRPVEPVRR